MSETKFRAWDKENKEMCRVIGIHYDAEGKIEFVSVLTPRDTIHYIDVKDLLLLQFSGFHDRNGLEIYVGDIICWFVSQNIIGEVKFEGGSFIVANNTLEHFASNDIGVEVIGNIYQNSKLLEEKK